MTTYELPPEPQIGESVQDALGRTWKHEGVNRWALKDDDADGPDTRSWRQLFLSAPLTLIEPDPWPTDDLIVADWIATGTAKGHGLAYLDGHEYVTAESGHVLRYGRNTLTNVVPVTVVPVTEWEALVDAWRSGMRQNILADHVDDLIAATDALGVSND